MRPLGAVYSCGQVSETNTAWIKIVSSEFEFIAENENKALTKIIF